LFGLLGQRAASIDARVFVPQQGFLLK